MKNRHETFATSYYLHRLTKICLSKALSVISKEYKRIITITCEEMHSDFQIVLIVKFAIALSVFFLCVFVLFALTFN